MTKTFLSLIFIVVHKRLKVNYAITSVNKKLEFTLFFLVSLCDINKWHFLILNFLNMGEQYGGQ